MARRKRGVTVPVTTRIPLDLYLRLKRWAEEGGLKVPDLVREALYAYLGVEEVADGPRVDESLLRKRLSAAAEEIEMRALLQAIDDLERMVEEGENGKSVDVGALRRAWRILKMRYERATGRGLKRDERVVARLLALRARIAALSYRRILAQP